MALSSSISNGNYCVIQGRLDAGASLKGSKSVLAAAVKVGQLCLVKMLFAAGADVRDEDHEIMVSAAACGNMGILNLLLAAGANSNLENSANGLLTALQAASRTEFLGYCRGGWMMILCTSKH
jgi:hypothetical protein